MKKLLFMFVILLIAPFCAHAEDYVTTYKVNDTDGLRVRSSATTKSSQIGDTLLYGTVLDVVDTVKSIDTNDTCDNKTWYKINISSQTGYVCSYYVSETKVLLNPKSDYKFDTELAKFPTSYQSSLTSLHKLHPNWEFYADNTNIKWTTVLSNESGTSKNLVQVTSSHNGYGYIDIGTFNWKKNTYTVYEGYNWYVPNKETVAHFLDPRTYLTEKYIFQFEELAYSPSQKLSVVQSILKNTFMADNNTYTYTDADGKAITKKYTDTFYEAGAAYSVSPYLLASRSKQEVGSTISNCTSGTYGNLSGYYNFYNIGAGTGSNTVTNALTYAKNHNWNSPYAAIRGGAQFLSEDYISIGQDNLYYQKWNTSPRYKSSKFTHQYMSNIEAPMNESYYTYKGYVDTNSVEDTFVFRIPVYLDMPASTPLPNKGNQNNWLSSIKIDNVELENYDGNVLSYNYKIKYDTTSINLAVIKADSKETVTGIGNISIPLEKTTDKLNIVVKAENGTTKTYTINIIRAEKPSDIKYPTIDEVMNDTGVKYDTKTNFITGIKLNTSIDSLKDILSKKSDSIKVEYIKNDNNKGTTIATNDTIKITIDTTVYTFNTVIYGDLNGDGVISAVDMSRAQKKFLKLTNLTGASLKACDINKDGNVTAIDLSLMQKHVLKIKSIEQ